MKGAAMAAVALAVAASSGSFYMADREAFSPTPRSHGPKSGKTKTRAKQKAAKKAKQAARRQS